MLDVVRIYADTIKWPDKCINCFQRPATEWAVMPGRFWLSGSLSVPLCSVCADERSAQRRRATPYIIAALAPFLTIGPLTLAVAWSRINDPLMTSTLIVVALGLIVWLALITATMYLRDRRRARDLDQSAIMFPVIVYRTYSALLPGRRHYALSFTNHAVQEYVADHN
jgi:hypothetical protein